MSIHPGRHSITWFSMTVPSINGKIPSIPNVRAACSSSNLVNVGRKQIAKDEKRVDEVMLSKSERDVTHLC
jgi:hypothetical protein